MMFHAFDEVAVMPLDARSPAAVVRIVHVTRASDAFTQTDDGRMYATSDACDLFGTRCRRIVLATPAHRAALARRTARPASCNEAQISRVSVSSQSFLRISSSAAPVC
jgi:hypothetical protein